LEHEGQNAGQSGRIEGQDHWRQVLQIKGQARQKVGGVKEAAKSIAYDANRSNKPVR
jgi:hypothetical protein